MGDLGPYNNLMKTGIPIPAFPNILNALPIVLHAWGRWRQMNYEYRLTIARSNNFMITIDSIPPKTG